MVLTVQQKPVTSGAATVVATATATTTTSGLQVGVGPGAGAATVTSTTTSTTATATAIQQNQRPVSLSATGNMSPSQPAISLHRASTAPAGGAPCNTRITGPQPVDVNRNVYQVSRRVSGRAEAEFRSSEI